MRTDAAVAAARSLEQISDVEVSPAATDTAPPSTTPPPPRVLRQAEAGEKNRAR
jgi:hypothetical protein